MATWIFAKKELYSKKITTTGRDLPKDFWHQVHDEFDPIALKNKDEKSIYIDKPSWNNLETDENDSSI